MWHVFEHLAEPKATLSKLSKIIKPGGILALALPNSDSINAEIFGEYWSGYDVPRHYFVYSLPLIKKLFEEFNFIVDHKIRFIGEFSSFKYSTEFWLSDRVKSVKTRTLLEHLLGSTPIHILLTPYFLVTNAMGKGSTMVIIARNNKNNSTPKSVLKC